MMGAALVVMADSAKAWLRKQRPPALDSVQLHTNR
jgi:hypothetical protein